MTKAKVTIQEDVQENGFYVFDVARKAFLVNLGAWAMVQEEAQKFANKLVERGEKVEKDARHMLDEFKTRRQDDLTETKDEMTTRIEHALQSLAVPSKTDINALSAKINTLTKKVEGLNKAQVAS